MAQVKFEVSGLGPETYTAVFELTPETAINIIGTYTALYGPLVIPEQRDADSGAVIRPETTRARTPGEVLLELVTRLMSLVANEVHAFAAEQAAQAAREATATPVLTLVSNSP
jgi:hypothetical protein